MRISDWSSDVCSSDLTRSTTPTRCRWHRASSSTCKPPVATDPTSGRPGSRVGTKSVTDPALRRRRGQDSTPACRGLRYRSEEHTSELQSLMRTSYAVFCVKKIKQNKHAAHKTT